MVYNIMYILSCLHILWSLVSRFVNDFRDWPIDEVTGETHWRIASRVTEQTDKRYILFLICLLFANFEWTKLKKNAFAYFPIAAVSTVYPKKCAHGFVVLCLVVVM